MHLLNFTNKVYDDIINTQDNIYGAVIMRKLL